MSTIVPGDAQVAAAPGDAAQKPAGAPDGFVPVAALQDERGNTSKAREESLRYRTALELHGFQMLEDGTVVPPAGPAQTRDDQGRFAPATPAYPPRLVALAEKLGVTAEELGEAVFDTVRPVGEVLMTSVGETTSDSILSRLERSDPDYEVYRPTLEAALKAVPPGQRITRAYVDQLATWSKGKHLDAISDRRAQRKADGGTVVGRFTEGAASGSQGTPQVGLPPDVASRMTAMGASADDLKRAADIRATRLANERRGS